MCLCLIETNWLLLFFGPFMYFVVVVSPHVCLISFQSATDESGGRRCVRVRLFVRRWVSGLVNQCHAFRWPYDVALPHPSIPSPATPLLKGCVRTVEEGI